MVERIINFLNKEVNGLHKAAFLLGFFALSSQLLALVRDRLLAHVFGAGVELDIYYAAFRIPDFIFITVASMVSVSVIVPLLVERIGTDKDSAKRFIDQIFSFFALSILAVTAVVFFLIPIILDRLFVGIGGQEMEQLITLTRLLLWSPILLGFSGLFGAVSQSYKRFLLYALSPVLYNIGIIGGVLLLTPKWGILGVGLGVVIGAVMHLAIHLPFVWFQGFWPRFTLSFDPGLIRKMLVISWPRTLTLAMTHIVLFVLIVMAAGMSEGSISVFQLAFNLQSVPLSIIGVSYSLAAFPTLSALFSENRHDKFLRYVTASARHIIFWSLPVVVLFVVLRAQIVRVILGTGEFGWVATQLTAAALALFAISVVFQGLVLLFIRSFYAMGKTVTPLIVSIISAVTAISSAVVLIEWFESSYVFRQFMESLLRLDGVGPGTEVILLALAYSAGIFVNAIVLWLIFQFQFSGFSASVFRTLIQVTFASLTAGAMTYIGLNIYAYYFSLNTFISVFVQGSLSGAVGVVMAALVLLGLDNREIKSVIRTLKQRFWKSRVIGPDPDVV